MHKRFSLAVSLLAVLTVCTNADAAKTKHHAKPHLHYEIRINSVVATAPASIEAMQSSWVQEGPNGLEARVVIGGIVCPEISVDGHDWIMDLRTVGDGEFATLCGASIPSGAKQAALIFRSVPELPPSNATEGDWRNWATTAHFRQDMHIIPLALPSSDPQRILVIGDTGCRIKGKDLQACNDPEQWPFPQMAAEAAKLKPDLVIHVGDYLYRENACPADFKGCQGTPFGDNWQSWDADFFTPAKPLLAAAPWIFVRGNHEDCERAGPGWLRLLGPLAFDPAAPCADHLAPYSVAMGAVNLVVMDNANAPDTAVAASDMAPVYRSEFASLASAPAPSWLLIHRPIWAAITGPLGIPAGGNLATISAIGESGIPSPVELMLSGHIHTFEAINYTERVRVPPQIVAGFGGDNLDPTPLDLKGTIFQGSSGVHVKDGLSIPGFGFLLMTKTAKGWTVDVYDAYGAVERQCLFHDGRVDCPKVR